MKRYAELTEKEQAAAREYQLSQLLQNILEGAIRFNDKLNKDKLQSKIDAAIKKADSMRTPWFAHEYIMETCREELEGMAQCSAEDAIYLDKGEHAVNYHKWHVE